jgi:hypothetical protein
MIQMFFKGGLGIENPIDADGKPIKVGDIITYDYFNESGDMWYEGWRKRYRPEWTEEESLEYRMKPCAVVRKHEKGFYYAEGLEISNTTFGTRLYFHDFRFIGVKVVGNIAESPHLFIELAPSLIPNP